MGATVIRTSCSEGDVCGSASMCEGPHAGDPRRALSAPKGEWPYTEATPDYLLRPTKHGPGMICNSGNGSIYLTINAEAFRIGRFD